MNVIAIHDGHNASVVLMKDGCLTYAVSEERLTRVKNQGGFPEKSISRVFSDAKIQAKDIDMVALCGIRPLLPEWVDRNKIINRYHNYCVNSSKYLSIKNRIVRKIPARGKQLFNNMFRPERLKKQKNLAGTRISSTQNLGIHKDKIHLYDHHSCHAAGAYYGQGDFDKTFLVITCDGGGDGVCATVNIGRNGQLEPFLKIPVDDSIAKLYALITYIMGFTPLEHEYKLMGLAPYADSIRAEKLSYFLEGLFKWNRYDLKWKRKNQKLPTSYWYNTIRQKIEFERFDVIAAGFQKFIENMVTRWIRGLIKHTGIRNIALSGGLFMNVKLNKLLMEMNEVESIYVLPSCSDESNPIGAAYLASIQSGIPVKQLKPLSNLYLGPIYSEAEVQNAVNDIGNEGNYTIQFHEDIESEVIKLLCDGNIIARYKHREEFGARALGNRSILADPSRLDVVREINKAIKCRDFWMPFAGTMTESQAEINLENTKNVKAPYMIMTFDSKNNSESYQAATHPNDRTIRPQIIERDWNPSYYKIISEFERMTGKTGGLLNTSFNLHGYPIVSSPKDAIDVFEKTDLKFLALGNYLLSKR